VVARTKNPDRLAIELEVYLGVRKEPGLLPYLGRDCDLAF
jgi:hypothetical protein